MRITTYFAGTLLLAACAHGSEPPPAAAPAPPAVSERSDSLGRLEPTPVAEQSPATHEPAAAHEPPAAAHEPRPQPSGTEPSFAGAADPGSAPAGSPVTAAGAQSAAGARSAAAHPPTRQENELRERIQSRLLSEQKLSYNARHVRVEVSQSDVTLQGEVRTAREKSDVEQVIHQIEGVRRVHNQLAVIDQTRPGMGNGLETR